VVFTVPRHSYNAGMTLTQLDQFVRSVLPMEEFASIDPSPNGIQVDRKNQDVRRVVTAVDASLETFRRAAEYDADVIFVHHGLFWGHEQPLTGPHYRRVRFLIEHDIALYAVHLPLDADPAYGNNAGIAAALGLEETSCFGAYKGKEIGVSGRLREPRVISRIVADLYTDPREPISVLPFGPETIGTVGIISGGGVRELEQAIARGLDLYITGDAGHVAYHQALEAGINVIFGGHYLTETWGVKAMADAFTRELDLDARFIDIPTGL
jgi:dinuclear metal center YbgI/SA1388 family protein